MEPITYQGIVKILLRTFPEFNNYNKDYLDIQHVIVGNFAVFLNDKIEKLPNDKVIPKSFEFINNIFSTENDKQLLDLIRIELFENLAQSNKSIEIARKYLKGNAIVHFEMAMKDFS